MRMSTTAIAAPPQARSHSTVTITVYGRTACQDTGETRWALRDAGVEYTFVELQDNPAALHHLAALQMAGAPTPVVDVVMAGRAFCWSGHRSDRILALVEATATYRTASSDV